MNRTLLLILSLIWLALTQLSLVWGLRLANSAFPTPFGNALRNSHTQRRAICSTPSPYDVVLTEMWKASYPDVPYPPSSPVFDEQVSTLLFFVEIEVFYHLFPLLISLFLFHSLLFREGFTFAQFSE
jgi:hypothetical protein